MMEDGIVKRRIAPIIISILILSVFCAPALASGDSGDVLGLWYLIRMEEPGVSVNPVSLELEVTLELFDTGRYEIWATGEEEGQAGAWTYADGLLAIKEDGYENEQYVHHVNGELMIVQGSFSMVFGREPAGAESEEASEVLSPARTDVTREDFIGLWVAFAIENEAGARFPMDLSEKIRVDADEMKMVSTMFGEWFFTGEMEGHQLVMSNGSTVIALAVRLTLHEDGTLSMLVEGKDRTLWYELGE